MRAAGPGPHPHARGQRRGGGAGRRPGVALRLPEPPTVTARRRQPAPRTTPLDGAGSARHPPHEHVTPADDLVPQTRAGFMLPPPPRLLASPPSPRTRRAYEAARGRRPRRDRRFLVMHIALRLRARRRPYLLRSSACWSPWAWCSSTASTRRWPDQAGWVALGARGCGGVLLLPDHRVLERTHLIGRRDRLLLIPWCSHQHQTAPPVDSAWAAAAPPPPLSAAGRAEQVCGRVLAATCATRARSGIPTRRVRGVPMPRWPPSGRSWSSGRMSRAVGGAERLRHRAAVPRPSWR